MTKFPAGTSAGGSAWRTVCDAVLGLGRGHAELIAHEETAWASATFRGHRHSITVAFRGEDGVIAGQAMLDALPEHEFSMPRRLVAEARPVWRRMVTAGRRPASLTAEVDLLVLDYEDLPA